MDLKENLFRPQTFLLDFSFTHKKQFVGIWGGAKTFVLLLACVSVCLWRNFQNGVCWKPDITGRLEFSVRFSSCFWPCFIPLFFFPNSTISNQPVFGWLELIKKKSLSLKAVSRSYSVCFLHPNRLLHESHMLWFKVQITERRKVCL